MNDSASSNDVVATLWQRCINHLETELAEQELNTWVRPLNARGIGSELQLAAPNRYVRDWVRDQYFDTICATIASLDTQRAWQVQLVIDDGMPAIKKETRTQRKRPTIIGNLLNASYTFETFVEGKSNELAKAAAQQVSANPGGDYNPLFIYGGVGLGKTHLMHSVGNALLHHNPGARIAYVHSERFVNDMIGALQRSRINEFKNTYRSLDALLIDDIQFLAGKERSQEEFFHTFNALVDGRQQLILSCDRHPREVQGLEERLKSRFGWGLTVTIEPPELETSVAILIMKARSQGVMLHDDVAFFIAQRIRSNVRDLEGALRRVIASAHFTGRDITVEFVKEALRDLLALQQKLITLENIQKVVADYYKIRVADLLSKRRSRSITRPRQLSMALAKELTHHSLPEIGDAFGGRDHTTVLHACRKIAQLRKDEVRVDEDYRNLLRTLTG